MTALDLPDLLHHKLNLCTDFLSATTALQELSASHPYSELDPAGIEILINKRHDCIEAIDRINERINSLRAKGPDIVATLSPVQRERVTAIAKKISDTVSEASRANSDLEKTLRSQHEDLKYLLVKVRHTQHGIQGYARKGVKMQTPRFLDVRL
jgi:chromosome segregation ATPase